MRSGGEVSPAGAVVTSALPGAKPSCAAITAYRRPGKRLASRKEPSGRDHPSRGGLSASAGSVVARKHPETAPPRSSPTLPRPRRRVRGRASPGPPARRRGPPLRRGSCPARRRGPRAGTGWGGGAQRSRPRQRPRAASRPLRGSTREPRRSPRPSPRRPPGRPRGGTAQARSPARAPPPRGTGANPGTSAAPEAPKPAPLRPAAGPSPRPAPGGAPEGGTLRPGRRPSRGRSAARRSGRSRRPPCGRGPGERGRLAREPRAGLGEGLEPGDQLHGRSGNTLYAVRRHQPSMDANRLGCESGRRERSQKQNDRRPDDPWNQRHEGLLQRHSSRWPCDRNQARRITEAHPMTRNVLAATLLLSLVAASSHSAQAGPCQSLEPYLSIADNAIAKTDKPGPLAFTAYLRAILLTSREDNLELARQITPLIEPGRPVSAASLPLTSCLLRRYLLTFYGERMVKDLQTLVSFRTFATEGAARTRELVCPRIRAPAQVAGAAGRRAGPQIQGFDGRVVRYALPAPGRSWPSSPMATSRTSRGSSGRPRPGRRKVGGRIIGRGTEDDKGPTSRPSTRWRCSATPAGPAARTSAC